MALIAERRQQEEENLELVNIDLEELKEFLLKSYEVFADLTIDSFIKPIAGGFENLTVLIKTKPKNDEKANPTLTYVCRISFQSDKRGTLDWLKAELTLFDIFHQNDFHLIPTIVDMRYPKENTQEDEQTLRQYKSINNKIFSLKGYFGVLMNYIEGEHITDVDGRREQWQVPQIGDAMGKFHSIVEQHPDFNAYFQQVRGGLTIKENADEVASLIEERRKLEKYREEWEPWHVRIESLLNFFVKDLWPELEVALPHLPHGVIHIDLHDLNVLFHNKQLAVILDWDDAMYGVLMYDIGLSILEWCCSNFIPRDDWIELFLKSYTKHRTLSTLEMKHIYHCAFGAAFASLAFVMQVRLMENFESCECFRQFVIALEHIRKHLLKR